MLKTMRLFALVIALALVTFGCDNSNPDVQPTPTPTPSVITEKASLDHVTAQMNELSPVTLTVDISHLSAQEQAVVDLLKQAADHMAEGFRRQVSDKNGAYLGELQRYVGTANQPYYDFFMIMAGPWDRLDGNAPFLNSDTKPSGAGYYPTDMTQEEFDAWIANHPEDAADFTGTFTMIQREGNGLKAVPYSQYFSAQLVPAAGLLRQAAAMTSDTTLATYLSSRADAFLSDDYRQSDMDWIDLAGDLEVVIGPYETYEDELFGYKAAFETYICVVDQTESEKLDAIETYRAELAANFPLPEGYTLEPKGLSSPIKVVNEIYATGDAGTGIRAIAFNLPNDEWVRENKGSKNVMLKNMMEAKYTGILVPISNLLLSESDRNRVSFDAYFNHVLMHEISHGLGPGTITKNGQETTVRNELTDLYSKIEECQADTLAVYNNQYLIDVGGPIPAGLQDSLYASYLAGMFRSIRFGINTSHGGGVAIQLNWHLDHGGFVIGADGKFSVNYAEIQNSVRSLAERLLAIEIAGDYDGATELMNTYKTVRPEVQTALDLLETIPTDVRPIYNTVK